MLPQALHVPGFEPGLLHRRHDRTDLVELTVGEHIAVDETPPGEASPPTRGATDRVIEEAATRSDQAVHACEVLAEAGGADVLEHPDRADRVEGAVVDVAVVLEPDLDPVSEAGVGDTIAGQLGMASRHGDPHTSNAVMLGGVQEHGAPTAADIEETIAGRQVELAGNQPCLAACASSSVVVASSQTAHE